MRTTVKIQGKTIHCKQFNNRDLSWLQFNSRVLNEALDARTPLFERLKFIDIFRSNNDEFFMKRMGSLIAKRESRNASPLIDGHSFDDLYVKLQEEVENQLGKLDECFSTDILPLLQDESIQLLGWNDISGKERAQLRTYFLQNIFPILTPLAVDFGMPFPFLSNLSKSIGLCIRKPKGKKKQFARVKIPLDLPQWIPLDSTKKFAHRLINIEEIISANIGKLFEGMQIDSMMIFRVTRSATMGDDDEDDDMQDLMELVEEGLKHRKFAPIVRIEYQADADPWLINYLKEELEVTEEKLYPIYSYLSYTNLSGLTKLPLNHLRYPPFKGNVLKVFKKEDLFQEISKKDILIHYPFDSYTESLELFLKAAVYDPQVKAIKMTLYRTDTEGRLIKLLLKASQMKKQVTCIVELTARFDEEQNIKWAQKLENAGIHVSYGLIHQKTHAKMLMVIRQEKNKLKTYMNIGTGNYNSQTSRLYTDFGLFTCNKEICADALYVFNYLTGKSIKGNYKKLLVAPFNMPKRFISMINAEMRNAKAGKPARIVAKMNSLEDASTIDALYKASRAGVKIDLIIRGFCSLKAQIKGLSDNIRVYSIVGRLLEHSRVFYFRNAAKDPIDGKVFMGSADWMHRNLYDRIEVITPIEERPIRKKIWKLMNLMMADNRHLWEMKSDGQYEQRRPGRESEINSQVLMIEGINELTDN